MNTTELREVLGQHAATVTSVPELAARVERRGRMVQKRRAVVSVAAVALAVAGVATGVNLAGGHRTAVPASRYGLPEYQHGMRLVVAHEGSSPAGLGFDVTLPATADGKPTYIGFALACSAPDADKAEVDIDLDGQNMGGVTGCAKLIANGTSDFLSWQSKVAFGTVHRVRVYWKDGQPHPGSTLLTGVYQAVPLSAYVFPSPPSQLLVPDTSPEVQGSKAIAQLSPSHPSAVIHPKHGVTLLLTTTEPGQLQLSINGRRVDTQLSWDYNEDNAMSGPFPLAQLHIKAGSAVTVRVVPTRFTGDTWRVAVADLVDP